jgi:predicted transcriptional regulator
MTKTLEKAFEQAAKLPAQDQDVFANFLLEELAFRAAVQDGIEAADRGDVVPLEDVKQMIPKWASK